VRHLPKARALTLAVAMAIATSCVATPAPAATRRPSTAFVIPTELPNGRVEITVAPSYPSGSVLTIQIAVSATRGTITGPISARVLASGINEGGFPAEVLVRDLAVAPVTVAAGRRSTSVSWDTKDLKGVLVPADAYTLTLEFRSEDAGVTSTARAATTVELR
jgi:hypothetical protein